MAAVSPDFRITVDDEVVALIEKVGKEMREAKEALSEERIRAIVREELILCLSKSERIKAGRQE